ncbi:DUF4170 domain-containing protein [Pseudomonas sp. GG8]
MLIQSKIMLILGRNPASQLEKPDPENGGRQPRRLPRREANTGESKVFKSVTRQAPAAAAPEQKGKVDPSMQSAKAFIVERPLNRQELRTGELMTTNGRQLLHFVFGGELKDLSGTESRDLSKLDIVGIFPDYASAAQAWKAKAQATVDNAHMRYFVAHLHRLLRPRSKT